MEEFKGAVIDSRERWPAESHCQVGKYSLWSADETRLRASTVSPQNKAKVQHTLQLLLRLTKIKSQRQHL